MAEKKVILAGEITERQTLWQMLAKKIKGEQEELEEFKVFNPLKGKVGDFISIEAEDLSGINFSIVEIDACKRKIGEEIFELTDYVLRDGETWVYLRVYPITNPEPYSHKHADVLLLSLDCEMEYNENFHKEILPNGILEVRDGEGKIIATYTRRGGLKEPQDAEITIIKVEDRKQIINEESVQCWDFERQLEDGSLEYYFVEMNNDTGCSQMFKGIEISEKDIIIFSENKK